MSTFQQYRLQMMYNDLFVKVFCCVCWGQSSENATPDLPGPLMAWPTLKDQPTGCTKGLQMWHQKSEVALSGASLWSAYISCRRPPTTDMTLATRVRLTCLGSTTSTRMPILTDGFMLSVNWEKYAKIFAWENGRTHYLLKGKKIVCLYLYVEVNR